MIEVALRGQDERYYKDFDKRLATRDRIREQLLMVRDPSYWLYRALGPIEYLGLGSCDLAQTHIDNSEHSE